ncbi:MAG: insulinase family protein [Candidatus Marinimicrobia bacterium]|nr:insulinase family protein [Candidatus Neomarinimicrobiota bacterium]
MKLKIKTLLVFALLFNGLLALNTEKIYEETLDNGLHVIAYEMHTAPMIYSHLTYNVGAKYENYGQTGISHIVEHMMFKGTERFNKGKISKLISANGGIFNAFTSSDVTVYYEFMPKNKIDLAFDIESERMHKCLFDPQEYESEIKVIKEERKMRTENSAQGQMREEMNTVIFKSHPYGNPVIGWMHDIDRITRDQAYSYYKKYYTPNNATLVLCGDFDTPEIMKKVKSYFGKIPQGPKLEKIDFLRVESFGKKVLEFRHSEIMSESVNMQFNVPTRSHDDAPALYVASRILAGRSATSRLNKRLVEKERLCKSTGGGYGFSKDPRTFSMVASLTPKADLKVVEKIIWEEIDSLKYHPVEDYDLQKIKNSINFNEITGDQYISKVGEKIGTYENYFGWEFINEWPRKIQEVSKQDIMDVMQKYMVEKNLFVCYSYPDTNLKQTSQMATAAPDSITNAEDVSEPDFADPQKKRLFSKILKLFGKTIPVEELYAVNPEEVSVPEPIAPLVKEMKLKNGTPVYFIENHDFPTVYVMGSINTGRIQEDTEKPGFSNFVSSMLSRGTATKTYEELLEERSYVPYSSQVSQSWHGITFIGYSLKKDADAMMQSLFEILAKPGFPESEIEKIRPRLINAAEEYSRKKEMEAFYKMFTGVFEGHQYALPHAGEPETYRSMNRQDMLDFHAKYYTPQNMEIVVVGDFDREWIENKLNLNFGSWKKESGDKNLGFNTVKPIAGRKIHVVPIPEGKQCRVDMAFNPVAGGIKIDNPDIPALEILEYILCGSTLTSRMGVELRDNRGLCYGIQSNLWVRSKGGYWNIRTNTDAENVKEMVTGMLEQIQGVQKNGITREELDKAKFRKISLLALNVRTSDDIGGLVYEMVRNDQPLDFFDQSAARYQAVTLEDVKRVANKYLDTENYIMSVSGNIPEDFFEGF